EGAASNRRSGDQKGQKVLLGRKPRKHERRTKTERLSLSRCPRLHEFGHRGTEIRRARRERETRRTSAGNAGRPPARGERPEHKRSGSVGLCSDRSSHAVPPQSGGVRRVSASSAVSALNVAPLHFRTPNLLIF